MLLSVIWKVCLNGLFESLFCSIVLVGTRKEKFVRLNLVLLLVYWLSSSVLFLDVKFRFHSRLILLLKLLKNQFQGLLYRVDEVRTL